MDTVNEKDNVGNAQTALSADQIGSWLAVFMSRRFAVGQPDLAVYARIISRLPIRKEAGVPAMAVSLENSKIVLLYNETWLAGAGFVEFTSTLAHEATHVLNGDIPRFLRMLSANKTKTTHHLLNIAMDAANNSLTAKRHKDIAYGTTGYWVMPEELGLPVDSTTEIYFEALSLKKQQIKEYLESLGSGASDFDSDTEDSDGDSDGDSGGKPEDGEDESDQGQGDNQSRDKDQSEDGGGGDEDQSEDGQGQSGEDSQAPTPPNATDIAKAAAMQELLSEKLKDAIKHMVQTNAHPWLQDGQSIEDAAAMADMVEEQAGEVVKKALEEQKSIGNLPKHLQVVLDALYEDSTVPWQEILRRQVTPRILSRRKATMVRPSKRRYTMFEEDEDGILQPLPSPIPQYPGGKRSRTFHILFAIDVSGSMTQSEIMEGLSEMKAITEAYPETVCTVLQVDTHISNITVISPEFDVDDYVAKVGRTAYGGTAFDHPFELAKYLARKGPWPARLHRSWEATLLPHAADFVIYHTDTYGEWPARELNPGVPVVWLVPKAYKAHANRDPTFGSLLIRE